MACMQKLRNQIPDTLALFGSNERKGGFCSPPTPQLLEGLFGSK